MKDEAIQFGKVCERTAETSILWENWVLNQMHSYLLEAPLKKLIFFVIALLSIEQLDSNKLVSISLKPKTCEDFYLPSQSETEDASSTLTSCSSHTTAITKNPVFREVTQININAIKRGLSPSQ